MDLATVRKAYETYTSKAGDVGRQLAFAGIAVIWLLDGHPDTLTFPPILLWALAAFGIYLVADFLQYIVASAVWGIYGWQKERGFDRAGVEARAQQFTAPDPINIPALAMFWLKSAVLLVGGVMLLVYVGGRIAAAAS